MTTVEASIQRLLDAIVAFDPVLATDLGLTTGMDRLPTFAPGAVAAHLAEVRALLPAFDRAAAGEGDEAADGMIGRLIVGRITRDLERRRVQHANPGVYVGPAIGVHLLMTREVAAPADRLEAVRGRLLALPRLLDEAFANLEGPVPEPFVRSAIEDAEGMRGLVGDATVRWAAALGFAGALDAPAREAAAALERWAARLASDLLPRAVPDVAAGRDLLVEILRDEYLLRESPEEIAEAGRELVAETKAAMAALAGDGGFASVEAAVAAAKADHATLDGFLAAYREAMAAARAFVVDHDLVELPADEELVVEETPAFARPATPFAAYWAPGPFAPRQRGFYWVTPPPADLPPAELEEALASHPTASMFTVGAHEAYPGHHTQFVHANRAPTLARRIAHLPDGGVLLAEGWAFYCEEMMETHGFGDAPAVRLMRLNDQLLRACRVVIDMDVHLGRLGFDAAVDYLARETRMWRGMAEHEVRWYVQEPGYPMAYAIGKREITALAGEYRRRRGGSLRAFHDELLSWGAAPPALIAWGMGLGPRPA